MKQAQIQSMETIAVLLVLFMILVFGLIFYARAQAESMGREIRLEEAHETIQVSQLITFSPALQCSNDNIVEDDCFDILKLEGLHLQQADNNLYFYDLFGYARIYVEKIYPEPEDWVIYERPPTIEETVYKTQVPILLKDVTTTQYYFGVLHVDSYQ